MEHQFDLEIRKKKKERDHPWLNKLHLAKRMKCKMQIYLWEGQNVKAVNVGIYPLFVQKKKQTLAIKLIHSIEFQGFGLVQFA